MFLPGLYKFFAVAAHEIGIHTRPILITATVGMPDSIIREQLMGTYYLGFIKLNRKIPYISIQFDNELSNFRILDVERDDLYHFQLANSTKGIIRDIHPDGTVKLRRK